MIPLKQDKKIYVVLKQFIFIFLIFVCVSTMIMFFMNKNIILKQEEMYIFWGFPCTTIKWWQRGLEQGYSYSINLLAFSFNMIFYYIIFALFSRIIKLLRRR